MNRLDVYRPKAGGRFLWLIIQSNLVSGLNTRIVVPLEKQETAPPPMTRLNPTFRIEGETFVMLTQFMAAVQTRDFGDSVTTLSGYETEITGAVDFLMHGY